jgi:ferritin
VHTSVLLNTMDALTLGMKMSKQVDLQEVYSTLEDLALCEGVPGVAEWIRDHLQKEYQVTLKYEPELDELK